MINGTTVVVQSKPVVEAAPQPLPPVTLTGFVSDSKGAPLPEVSIMIKGTSTGVTTDENGKFSIQLPNDNSTLVFSLVGFASQEIRVRGKTTISITLREKPSPLDEIVVVGYGTRRRSDITGAVSICRRKRIA